MTSMILKSGLKDSLRGGLKYHLKLGRPAGVGALALAVALLFLLGRGTIDVSSWFMATSRDAGFVLNDLQVTGHNRTAEHDILATLDIDDGMPLFAIELEAIQARITALPWVKEAKVVRRLPGALDIILKERQPFARWQHDGQMTLIDTEGVEIPGQDSHAFEALPWVVGVGADREAATLFDMLGFAPALAERVKQAVWVGERRWDIIFDNGVRLKLPEALDPLFNAEAAWARFARIENTHRILAREINVIDMRLKDRVIMRVSPAGARAMSEKEVVL